MLSHDWWVRGCQVLHDALEYEVHFLDGNLVSSNITLMSEERVKIDCFRLWACKKKLWRISEAILTVINHLANFFRFHLQCGDQKSCMSNFEPIMTQKPHFSTSQQLLFSREMNHTDSYRPHCFLSPSPSLLIYLSFSLWHWSNCSLFPTPLPQHCCCCCCW